MPASPSPTPHADLETRKRFALSYLRRGWHLLPCWWVGASGRCACGGRSEKNPCHAGKHPVGRLVPQGLRQATDREADVMDWFRALPSMSLAVRTGSPSGIVAVDVDPRSGGLHSLEKLRSTVEFPRSAVQLTPSGGYHIVYSYAGSDVASTVGTFGSMQTPGLDVRAEGGYVMLAASNHTQGLYKWHASRRRILPLPSSMLDLLKEKSPQKSLPGGECLPSDITIPRGQLRTYMLVVGGRLRRVGMPCEVIRAALLEINERFAESPCPASHIDSLARWISDRPVAKGEDAIALAKKILEKSTKNHKNGRSPLEKDFPFS